MLRQQKTNFIHSGAYIGGDYQNYTGPRARKVEGKKSKITYRNQGGAEQLTMPPIVSDQARYQTNRSLSLKRKESQPSYQLKVMGSSEIPSISSKDHHKPIQQIIREQGR